MMRTDWELLDAYCASRDGGAFAEIVRRHVPLVYHTARRALGGPGAEAEDVAQAVFLLLSQKADRIRRGGDATLAGWLFNATRFCCANVRKTQGRRRKHEREAAMETPKNDLQESARDEAVIELLNDGLAALGEKERQAILLRYLESQSPAEAAAALGLSAAALEKRLQRGLGHLRAFFAKKGYALPAAGVVTLLGIEGAKAAPAPLAATVAASVHGASAGTVALAKGTATMMALHTTKVAAGIALAAALAVSAGVGAVLTVHGGAGGTAALAAGRPGAPVAIVGVPRAMLVRYDFALTADGLARVRALGGTAEAPAGQGYTAVVLNAERLREALAAADAAGEMPGKPNWIAEATANDMPQASVGREMRLASHRLFTQAEVAPNVWANISTGMMEGITVDPRGTVVRLKIDDKPHPVFARDRAENDISGGTPVAVTYAGDVPLGQAAVFIAELGTVQGVKIHHVSVWEAFAASDKEWPSLRGGGGGGVAGWWKERLDTRLAMIDRALVWNAGAREAFAHVPPAWERRLPGGSVLRLVAVADETRWPECWWDAEGNGVVFKGGWGGSNFHTPEPAKVTLAIWAEDPSAPADKLLPGMTRGGAPLDVMRNSITLTNGQDADGALEVGMGSGPWHEVGALTPGKEITVEGHAVKLLEVQPASPPMGGMPGSAWVRVQGDDPREMEIQLVPVNKTGGRGAGEGPKVRLGIEGRGEGPQTRIVQMAAPDIDHFVVRWRKREWATFAGYATSPKVVPDAVFAAPSKVAPPVTAVPASQPAAGTPEGFFPQLLSAARTHDAVKVRALMVAEGEAEKRYADMRAEQVASAQMAWDALDARFSPEEVEGAFGGPGLLPRVRPMEGVEWKVTGDRAEAVIKRPGVVMVSGGERGLVRVKGEWKMEVRFPAEVTSEQMKELERYLPRAEKEAEVRRAFAEEVRAGKFKDVYEARDALRARVEAARK